jgi:hypothetical protein
MSLKLKLDFPNAAQVMRDLGTDAAKAQTRAMAAVVDGWKGDIRPLVRQNFRRTPGHAKRAGLNYEKSFQGDTYPSKKSRKVSFQPAGFLQAKADFARIFEDGGTVEGGKTRKYLAIALPGARKLKLDYQQKRRFTKSSNVEKADRLYGPLRPIPASGGGLVLAADARNVARAGLRPRGKKRDFVPLFLLVKRVRLPKKLSFIRLAQLWLNRLPAETEREVARIQGRP